MENILFENETEAELKSTDEELKSLTKKRELIVKNILKMHSDISNNRVQLDFLNNYDKYISLSNTGPARKNALLRDTYRNISHEKNPPSTDFDSKNIASRDVTKRGMIMQNCEDEIIQKKELINNQREEVDKLNEEIKRLSHISEQKKNNLLIHLHLLLNEGKDTRTEGLVWIIRDIWKLNCNVIISYLPAFLDEEAIEYIFSIAHKEVNLLEKKNTIDETKQKVRFVLKNKFGGNKSDANIFKTDLNKRNASPISAMNKLKLDVVNPEEKFNMKKIEAMISNKKSLDEETISMLKSVRELENVYYTLRDDIRKSRRMQMSRLGKEFLVNDYARRYNTKLEIVASAIVGEDNLTSELVRQNREKKVRELCLLL